jgi:hypothetical protein
MRRVERDIGRHLAVILEIDPALVEDLHRLAHALGALALGMAEGGIGEHRDARLVAQRRATPAASSAMSASLLRVGMSCTAVSATSTVRPRQSASETPMTRWPGLASMHAADVFERGRIVARHAGHHRVGIAQRHHAGGEMVAVVVDQALAVAVQKPLRCRRS